MRDTGRSAARSVRGARTAVVGAALAGLLLAPSVPWLAGSAAAAPEECAVATVLSPSSREAAITMEQNGAATFRGVVAVNKPENWTGWVRLELHVSLGWAGAIAPENLSFSQGARLNASYNVTVVVPAATSTGDVSQVTVTARGQFNGTLCAPAMSQSIVKPHEFYGVVTVEASPSSLTLGSGNAPALVFVRAQQITNAPYPPILSGVSVEAPAGIRVSSPPTITMSALSNTSIGAEFQVQIEWAGTSPGRHHVSINVRSGAPLSSAHEPTPNATAAIAIDVPEPLGTFQLWASAAIGAVTAVALGVWTWRSSREAGRRP